MRNLIENFDKNNLKLFNFKIYKISKISKSKKTKKLDKKYIKIKVKFN